MTRSLRRKSEILKFEMTNTEIRAQLFAQQDASYRDFTAKLIPTADKDKIIGVRNPVINQLAKDIVAAGAEDFLQNPPTEFHEERLLYSFVLGRWKTNIESFLAAFDKWLPCVNNWAVCDSGVMGMKILSRPTNQARVWEYLIKKIENTDEPYIIRAIIVVLFSYFIDKKYVEQSIGILQNIKSEDYYVNMALAWAFSVIIIKHYKLGLNLIKSQTLGKWVQNKSIQKSLESYRLTVEQKQELKLFKL